MHTYLQTRELHFVSVKSSNFRSSLIRIFMPLFFLLAFCCMQTELHAQQKSTPTTKSTPVVENTKQSADNVKLTLRYDVPKFKAGEMGVSKPIVNVEGGVFSYERLGADSRGGLLFNATSGMVFHKFSDPGQYRVTYTFKNLSASFTLNVE